jgi:hypothetical protein
LLHVTAFLTFTHPDSFQIFKGHGKLLDCKESRKKDDSEASIEGLVYPIYRSGFDEVETSTETTNPKVMQPADFTISHSLVPLLTTLLSHTHATLSSPA